MDLNAIQELRQQMAAAGWSPVPLVTGDKAVKIPRWSELARGDNGYFAKQPVREDMANTGFLCDGLRVVDIDIDDPDLVQQVLTVAANELGRQPLIRSRGNSCRLALVYRAAEGTPVKATVSGAQGKVEILGRGQQLHAFGLHPSGAEPTWHPAPPGEVKVADLLAVADSQVDRFLRGVASVLGTDAPQLPIKPAAPTFDTPYQPAAVPRTLSIGFDNTPRPEDLRDALMAIPNAGNMDDWHAWNRVAMALWSATGGAGFDLFDQWSRKHPSYDAQATRERWSAITRSPPKDLHAGTIFWIARHEHGWKAPYESERLVERPARVLDVVDRSTGEILGQTVDDTLAVRFAWQDPAKFPRRKFLYGTSYIRKFLSVDVAPGGVGKSSLALVELLAICTGHDLLGITPNEVGPVWYHNGEDPLEEVDRRIIAAALHYEIDPYTLESRLFRSSGRDTHLVIAEQHREGAVILKPNVEAVIDTIRRHGILVARFDPFVSTHMVTENDNNAIAAVARQWAQIADITGASIALTHHSRKSNGNQTTIEDARGAVALIDASRSVRALNSMSEDEAAKAGVKARRAYFRVDQGKTSMGPAPDQAEWYHIAGVTLPNGDAFEEGDSVGVVERWEWPDPFAGVTPDHAQLVQQAVERGGPYRLDFRSNEWVGRAVAGVLGTNPDNKADRERIKRLVDTWVATGVLETYQQRDAQRKERTYVRAGTVTFNREAAE